MSLLQAEDVLYILEAHTRLTNALTMEFAKGNISRWEYRKKIREEVIKTLNAFVEWQRKAAADTPTQKTISKEDYEAFIQRQSFSGLVEP